MCVQTQAFPILLMAPTWCTHMHAHTYTHMHAHMPTNTHIRADAILSF